MADSHIYALLAADSSISNGGTIQATINHTKIWIYGVCNDCESLNSGRVPTEYAYRQYGHLQSVSNTFAQYIGRLEE